MTEKLGPCPLCRKQARGIPGASCGICCEDPACEVYDAYIPYQVWNRLSAMAASERRMRAALERCRDQFHAADKALCWVGENGQMRRMCDEALKGGEG